MAANPASDRLHPRAEGSIGDRSVIANPRFHCKDLEPVLAGEAVVVGVCPATAVEEICLGRRPNRSCQNPSSQGVTSQVCVPINPSLSELLFAQPKVKRRDAEDFCDT
jgi:hypothetical protein